MGYEIFDQLCKEKGVKAIEVCRETGVDPSTISSWKHGKYTPKQDKMQKLADYFGVSREYLLTGKTERQIQVGQLLLVNNGIEKFGVNHRSPSYHFLLGK